MSINQTLIEVKNLVRRIVPPRINITDIDFEGPVVVIYTTSLDEFATNNDIVRRLAQGLKRRVAIRPDPTVLKDIDEAETMIKHIIPEDAEITDVFFDVDVGEVTIEAMSPGTAIGKHGQNLNTIKKEIGWAPRVVRTPPLPSKMVKEIRGYLRQVGNERKTFLKRVGRRIYKQTIDEKNYVRSTFLGGMREVGRSCTLFQTRNSKILIDCGINVADDENSSPYLNAPEVLPLETIDAVVITHAHLDHSGLVPLLYKFGYDGPVYCTPPTRDMMALLHIDYLKVAVAEGRKTPYESSHVRKAVQHTIPLKYGETTDIASDLRLTLQNAGHILGSSICHLHVGDGLHNIAFSGDIKFEKTWLFNAASNKFPRLETLVIESTYGGKKDFQPARKQATRQLKDIIKRCLGRGGKVIIPVFAVGRSQEVMISLYNMIRRHEIDELPIYLDGMIMEATAIHTAYPEYLNNKLRNQIFQRGDNPFMADFFHHVDSREKRLDILTDPDPCIILATSGMMSGGPVMEYFKSWAPDKKNSLIFVGYQAEGTLGRKLQRGKREIVLSDRGETVKLGIKMNIETCDGFSGHSDRRQLVSYIATCSPRPERVIMGHGDINKCQEFAKAIHKKYNLDTCSPQNLETIRYM